MTWGYRRREISSLWPNKIRNDRIRDSPLAIDLGKDSQWRLKLLGKMLGDRIFPQSQSIAPRMSHQSLESQREKGDFTSEKSGGNHINQVMKSSVPGKADELTSRGS